MRRRVPPWSKRHDIASVVAVVVSGCREDRVDGRVRMVPRHRSKRLKQMEVVLYRVSVAMNDYVEKNKKGKA